MLRRTILAALATVAVQAAAQGVPFTVEIEEVGVSNAPPLHSTAHAEHAGRWLFVTGRTDGLHGLTAVPDPFPAQFANGAVVVYELASDMRWTASLDGLPADLRASLRAQNTQFLQAGSTLYVVGGYGRNAAGDNVTFPTLTAIDVPGIIAAVQAGTPLAPHIRQIVDQRCAVTGGHLIKQGDRFQIVGGNRFDGDYLGPNMVQTYTEAVRSLWLSDDGSTLAITGYEEDVDATNLHRRDVIVAPFVGPAGELSYALYGGVFNQFTLPHRQPILIGQGSHETIDFAARFGHYTTPALAMHDARDNTMHTVFFGGLGQFWFDEATSEVREDFLVPFIDDVAAVSRSAAGTWSETVLAARMPGYLGTNAQFFPADVPMWDNGAVRLESLSGRTLVGYIHGGISTQEPHPGWMGGPSQASDRVMAVYVTPQPLAGEEGPAGRRLSLTSPTPNPATATARMILTAGADTDVLVELFDGVGRRLAVLREGPAASGDHPVDVDVSALAEGLYVIRASDGRSSATRRIVVAR